MREDALADESGETAAENAQRNQGGGAIHAR